MSARQVAFKRAKTITGEEEVPSLLLLVAFSLFAPVVLSKSTASEERRAAALKGLVISSSPFFYFKVLGLPSRFACLYGHQVALNYLLLHCLSKFSKFRKNSMFRNFSMFQKYSMFEIFSMFPSFILAYKRGRRIHSINSCSVT